MSVELVAKLKALKLHGMAQTWPELMAKARHADIAPEQLLGELLAAETAEREVRSIAYQMTAARFPAHRDLAGFRFAESRVDEELIRRLHAGQFMDDAQNLVFIGGPGTGKTHLATAIGIEAIQRQGGSWSPEEEAEFKRPTLEMFERQSHPLYASARLWDDGIIDPRQTRAVLALSLSATLNAPIPPTRFGLFRM